MNECIQLMIDWIEENLKDEFSIEDLASIWDIPLIIVLLNFIRVRMVVE